MKTLRYKLDNSFMEEDKRPKSLKEYKTQFGNILGEFLRLGYKDGLSRQFNRNFENILGKVDKASGSTVEIEDAEFDMVWFLISEDKVKTDPAMAKIVNRFYEVWEEAKLKAATKGEKTEKSEKEGKKK